MFLYTLSLWLTMETTCIEQELACAYVCMLMCACVCSYEFCVPFATDYFSFITRATVCARTHRAPTAGVLSQSPLTFAVPALSAELMLECPVGQSSGEQAMRVEG